MNASVLSLALLVLSGPAVETSKEPSTHLYVRTVPPGGKIILDERPGTTDGLLSVTPGKHRIVVELDGYAPERREVDVPQGRITRVEVSLKRAAGRATIDADPFAPTGATQPKAAASPARAAIDGNPFAPTEGAGAKQPGAKGPAVGATGPTSQPTAKAEGIPAALAVGQDQSDKVEDLVEKALLEKDADFAFDQTPLTDVVEHLQRMMKINILLDAVALEDSSIDPSTSQVTIAMRASRGSAIDLMLSQMGLTWTVRDGAMVITTARKAQEELSTKVYPIEDLSLVGGSDRMIQIITSTIAPQTWGKAGGPGSIADSPRLQPPRRYDRLVVRQTYQVHRQIRQLLATLRTMDADAAAGKTPEPVLLHGALTASPAAVQYYRKALAQPVSEFDFEQTPLTDLVEHVVHAHKMNVVLDSIALENESIDASTTAVTFSVKGIPLGQALSLLLERLGLTWILEGDYVRITTKQFAEGRLVVGVYPVGDLAESREGPYAGNTLRDSSRLIATITNTIAPKTWSAGRGSILPIESGRFNGLVVLQTDAVHRQIAALLTQLRAKEDHSASPKAAEGTPSRSK